MRSAGSTKSWLYLLSLPLNPVSRHDRALQTDQEFQLLHPSPSLLVLLAHPEKQKQALQVNLQISVINRLGWIEDLMFLDIRSLLI